MPDELTSKLESLLFVASRPVTTKQLAELVGQEPDKVQTALTELATIKKQAGVVLLENGGQWQLATHPSNVNLVKAFLTADLREKLTDASLEVLGIIAYRQPVTRAEVEAVRGVNCQYSIRQLLMRGLIEKVASEGRGNYYQVTLEFLQQMGLGSVSELPEFEKLTASIRLPETSGHTENGQQNDQNSAPHTYTEPTTQASQNF